MPVKKGSFLQKENSFFFASFNALTKARALVADLSTYPTQK
jgi:hypothetical protein